MVEPDGPRMDIALQHSMRNGVRGIRNARGVGATALVKEVRADLAPLFGDVPYLVRLVAGYGRNFDHVEPDYATLWVWWWPHGSVERGERDAQDLEGWWLLVRMPALRHRVIRATITGMVGRCMLRYKDHAPEPPGYGPIPERDELEEFGAALKRLYPQHGPWLRAMRALQEAVS
jgi:hypothetical protein